MNRNISIFLLLVCGFFTYNNNVKPQLKVRSLNQYRDRGGGVDPIIKDILEEKYELKATRSRRVYPFDKYDLVINHPLGKAKIKDKNIPRIYVTGEAHAERLEGYDLSLGFNYFEDRPNYIRAPLYYFYFKEKVSTDYKRGKCKTDHPYFACFLVSNGYKGFDGVRARDHLFYRLSLYKPVTSGGKHLNNIQKLISPSETDEFLSKCKFTIAYENQTYPGYMTEKLFQAYFAGSVPLYYSDKKAQEDINKKAIISAQEFKTEEEMVDYIIKVDQDEKKYCEIYEQPIIIDPARNYEVLKAKIRAKLEPIVQKIK